MAGRGGKGGSHKPGAPNVDGPTEQVTSAAMSWRLPPKKPLYEVRPPPPLGSDNETINRWAIEEAYKAYGGLISMIDHRNGTQLKAAGTLLGFIQRISTEHNRVRNKKIDSAIPPTGAELSEEALRKIVAEIEDDAPDEDDT